MGFTVSQDEQDVDVAEQVFNVSVDGEAENVFVNEQTTVVVTAFTTDSVVVQEPVNIVEFSTPATTLAVTEQPATQISFGEGRGPAGADSEVPGPKGDKGDKGDPGGGGGGADDPIVYEQPNPSSMWHIVHGRGTNPSVVVVRSDGVRIGGFGTVYPDHNTVDIYPGLIAGEATLTF